MGRSKSKSEARRRRKPALAGKAQARNLRPAGEDGNSEGGPTRRQLISPETGEIYDYSRQVGHLLRKAYQRHTTIFQQNSVDPQLTSVQLAVLCALAEYGPLSLTALGKATAIDPATLRGIIERLAARGFVKLDADPKDARKIIVALNKAGQEMVYRMLPRAFEITRRTMESLNAAEQIALNYLLAKISA